MRGDKANGQPSPETSGEGANRALWQRAAVTETTEHEAELLLDLAGFADDRLDPDEHARIAERLARDPVATGDVAAARALAREAVHGEVPASVIARASALAGDRPAERGRLIPFPRLRRPQPTLPGLARWASLAAALVVASWLG